ncbi:MAG: amidase [Candidatus Liberibacter europaeus]|uniref:Amidase n=1 Tax=Candidatus Liberibacter europaeus TaxID=744859 RepID=A0A2T4VYI9_9HYPH|nr:amidase [Candidatus Liberibacter europaeus]PTL86838.1 MAG: amidase [Candidatus Liberibacter europaeus]
MFSIASFFIVCPPLYADVLDDVIKDFYHSNSDGRFDTLLSRSDIEIDSDNAIVSNATVANIKKAILFYQSIVDKGGWPQLPYDKSLQLGSTSILVQKLRERLIISHDLDPSKGFSTVFDSYVESAVKYFQVRHGLPPEGIVTESTIRAMNVPADVRLRQLRVNLARILALLKQNMGNRYVIVNIPSATIDAVEGDKVVWSSVAIVGRTDRQTPILHSKINRIVLNPYWVIPRSIIKNDVMSLMRQDPSYLTESNIHLINYEGVEVKPEDVDWHASEAPNLIFRQDPGKINAMASTKIEFYSQSNAYMHDTPEPALFRNPMRFETSGCVRVSNITNLSVWLLKDTPGWSRNNIEKVIQTRKTTPIIVNNPISVHFVYISAWSAKDLVVQFRDDVYGLDNIHKASVPLSISHSIQPQPAD